MPSRITESNPRQALPRPPLTMSPSATSTQASKSLQRQEFHGTLGSLFQRLTPLLAKKFSLTSNLNHPWPCFPTISWCSYKSFSKAASTTISFKIKYKFSCGILLCVFVFHWDFFLFFTSFPLFLSLPSRTADPTPVWSLVQSSSPLIPCLVLCISQGSFHGVSHPAAP